MPGALRYHISGLPARNLRDHSIFGEPGTGSSRSMTVLARVLQTYPILALVFHSWIAATHPLG